MKTILYFFYLSLLNGLAVSMAILQDHVWKSNVAKLKMAAINASPSFVQIKVFYLLHYNDPKMVKLRKLG